MTTDPPCCDSLPVSELLSVVVITYNSAPVLTGMLAALKAVLPNSEVIFVDNGSSDETHGILERSGTDATLILGHGNVGFGAGANIGARAASRDLLLILNPDARPCAVDERALALLARQTRVGLLACAIRAEAGNTVHMLYRQWGWRRELWWHVVMSFLVPRELRIARPRVRRYGRAHWALGAALLVNRGEFLEVGGFDDRFFLYGEDRDLGRTYRAQKLPVCPTDAVTVEHDGGASSPVDVIRRNTWIVLSRLEYAAKWHGESDVVRLASRYLAALALIGRLPRVGRLRGAADRAIAVCACLADIANQPGVAAYPAARETLAELGRRRNRSSH